ncbi:MAG: hypothetical protein ACMUJM_15575 [bacterium]
MKSKMFIIFISSFIIIMASAYINYNIKDTEEITIKCKIKEDAACLSQMEAIYSLAFTHFRERTIVSDDIYLRRDLATVFYGYSFDKLQINIIEEDNERILHVSLPQPQIISYDRKTKQVECTHDSYHPTDETKKEIDIDKILDDKLKALVNKYEAKSIETTKELSRLYFKALAKRFGLKLEMEYL